MTQDKGAAGIGLGEHQSHVRIINSDCIGAGPHLPRDQAAMNQIVTIQGHPDNSSGHFCHALEEAYREGASSAGHKIDSINLAELDFPWLRSREDWEGDLPQSLEEAARLIQQAEHLVFFYPLWLGTMPALMKAFIEQVFRPGIALQKAEQKNAWPQQKLKGKSCRIVVTMGMPALFYRWYYRAHSLKSLERNILKFSGINPVRETLLGLVEGVSDQRRQAWLAQLRKLGSQCR